MPQKRNIKIFTYILLFLVIGTINNKNINDLNLININEINISGLDKENNLRLIDQLSYLKIKNIFFLDRIEIIKTIDKNNFVQKYSVQKNYPSTIDIKVDQTKIMAQVIKNNEILFLGSNGKLIRNEKLVQDVPSIFGTFDVQNFFDLKKALNESDFSYNQIKNLFFFKSGRWDIETISGVIIKLPPNNLKKKLELVVQILNEDKRKRINQIDLRQKDQIIIDER